MKIEIKEITKDELTGLLKKAKTWGDLAQATAKIIDLTAQLNEENASLFGKRPDKNLTVKNMLYELSMLDTQKTFEEQATFINKLIDHCVSLNEENNTRKTKLPEDPIR